MKNQILLISILLLTGCMAGMPNNIKTSTSSFDNSQHIQMEPGFVYENADFTSYAYFKLGLSWNSNDKNVTIITAEIPQSIVNINSNKGLQFNIDGEIVKFDSYEIFTKHDVSSAQQTVYSESKKRFVTDKSFIKKLITAKSVKVKLLTGDGYLEGDLLVDKPSAAIHGFKDFIQQI